MKCFIKLELYCIVFSNQWETMKTYFKCLKKGTRVQHSLKTLQIDAYASQDYELTVQDQISDLS